MPLEMGKHDHGIVIDQMAAHGHFREVQAAAHRERHIAFLIHDIHGAEIPAVDPERFTMRLRCVAIPPVQRIGFHDAAFRHPGLEGFHHVAGQDVRSVSFSGMQLDGCFAVNMPINLLIKANQMLRVNMRSEIDPCAGAGRADAGDVARTDKRRLPDVRGGNFPGAAQKTGQSRRGHNSRHGCGG